jgi:hypothetical protein
MKRIKILSVALIILVFMIHGNVLGKATLKVKVGDTLPDVRLPVPDDPSHRKYLGLTTSEGKFGIQDIKAEVVIIQFFQWN